MERRSSSDVAFRVATMKLKEAVTGLVPNNKGVKRSAAEGESNMCTRWKKITWVCAGQ